MKKLLLPMIVMTLLVITAIPVFAGNFTGGLRISPALPLMVASPATFETWLQPPPAPPATDQSIVLVMTKACYDGLSPVGVLVTWTGGSTSFPKSVFTPANTGYVPSSGAEEGGRYTVASLQDHLGVPHSEMVYYAYGLFLANPITQTHQTFTVTLSSTHTRMLVYAIGKSDGSTLFNQKVPPTIPGFVVPELGPVLLSLASFSALALYWVKGRKVRSLK